MTKAELIKALEQYPDDILIVGFYGGGCFVFSIVQVIKLDRYDQESIGVDKALLLD
jgi:hypothetical protein